MQTVIEGRNLRPDMDVVIVHWLGGTAPGRVLAVTPQHNSLGARWSILELEVAGEVHPHVDSRQHLFLTPERPVWVHCPNCRTRREVVDDYTDSTYTPEGEQTYRVRHLDCGHQLDDRGPIVGAAPGEPYVGPVTVVDPSLRPRDRRAGAHRRNVPPVEW